MRTFYVLGIDQSTQGTKAVIFNDEGYIVERYDLAHRQIINDEGWVSHDPSEIYENVIGACKGVIEKSGIDKRDICCMGVTNQRETTVAWNKKTGEPLDYAIVWQCNRAKDICVEVKEKFDCEEEVYYKTGLKLSPFFPASKMSWLLKNISEVKKNAEEHTLAFGTIDSWLIYKLTGGKEHKTDFSNASRTQLFNLRTLQWDKEICKYFEIPEETLPIVEDSDAVFGKTNLEGLLDEPIPICGVLGDSHGALFGHNCRKQGDIKTTYGTGSSVMLNTGSDIISSHQGLSTSLAWKIGGKVSYVLEGNINYTGAVISWLKNQLGLIASAKETEQLAKEASENDTTYLVPAFTGLGAPWWKNDAKAMIFGMSRSTGKKELVRAACDCIAYQINDVVSAMRKDTELEIKEMCVDGGPTRNNYLMQFQSDIVQAGVKIPNVEELSVIGTAFLAGISYGIYDASNIYDSISYEYFEQKMDDIKRVEKQNGWNEAIQMLIK